MGREDVMTEEEALALLESLTVAERKEIPLEDFAWPEERKFPCDTQEHVDACAKLLGHAPENMQAKIKARAIRIAKRHKFTLPDSWKEEEGKESASLSMFQESAGQRPQKKIGSLPICWLEYNARSLNGRIYPKATCDAIFQSAKRKLADSNALPATTFVSHEAANGNVNTDLVGHVSKVWQEGAKFWATIDLADTSVARDMLGLVENGALKSGSMRVQGVQLMHDRNYDLPLVVVQEGVEPDFMGIDLTTRPGLTDIARIPQALYESDGNKPYVESFNFEFLSPQKEGTPPAMGTPVFIQVVLGTLEESSSKEAHMRVHDHLAGVLDECMAPKHGSESVRYKALIEGQLDEAGKAIAMKHAKRLVAAHDESARQLGMKCEGCYSDALANPDDQMDGDSDGDSPATGNDPDNDGESQKENKTLTEQEMIELLKAKGFAIDAPKTPEQKKIEEQDAKIAALEAKFAQMHEGAPTQRQTEAHPSQFEESTLQPERLYQEGDYLAGQLRPQNWRALANPQVPWPEDLDPKLVLHELTPYLEYNLLNMQESTAGRSLREEIKLGLFD